MRMMKLLKLLSQPASHLVNQSLRWNELFRFRRSCTCSKLLDLKNPALGLRMLQIMLLDAKNGQWSGYFLLSLLFI
jgi:hypothetical protein